MNPVSKHTRRTSSRSEGRYGRMPSSLTGTRLGQTTLCRRQNLRLVPRRVDACRVSTFHDGEEASRGSLASIAVYGMSPIGLAAYWWLRSEELLASTPVWLLAAMLVVAGVSNLVTA